jgi:protocatechuate 3,4-dioxygenase alpha subunit
MGGERRLPETPSQTAGPYWSMRLAASGENVLTTAETLGPRVRIEGRVLDGDGKHIEDALVEVWQANAAGRYRHPADDRDEAPLDPAFTGFGRAASDFETGEYWFETVKPGQVPAPEGGLQAPHLNVIVQGRGMLNPGFTRIYFGDETEANEADPTLARVAPERRATLIAELVEAEPTPTYRFDVRFQGPDETVFFDV